MIGVGVCVGDVAGLSDIECACTLGIIALSVGVALGAVICNFDYVSTLGGSVGGFGNISALLIFSALFCRALRVRSPVSKLGVVIEVGAVRMVIMSVATCLKKSSKPIFGIGISLGKKLLCPHSLPILLAG